MIGLMPFMGGVDKGLWTYVGQFSTTTTRTLTLPAGLQNGDYGVIVASTCANMGESPTPITVNGTAISAPPGWTALSVLNTQWSTPGVDWTQYFNANGGVLGAPLTAAMSGTTVTYAATITTNYPMTITYLARLLLFRNTRNLTPSLNILATQASGAFPSQSVAFNTAGSPVLAGYAITGSSISNFFATTDLVTLGTLNGAAWPGTFVSVRADDVLGTMGLSAGFGWDLQKPGTAKTVANTTVGSHRLIGVGL